jgi:hypothetical protein
MYAEIKFVDGLAVVDVNYVRGLRPSTIIRLRDINVREDCRPLTDSEVQEVHNQVAAQLSATSTEHGKSAVPTEFWTMLQLLSQEMCR